MKVCIICSLPISLITFRGKLLREFSKQNIEIIAFAPGINKQYQIKDELEKIGVKVYDYKLRNQIINPFYDFF